MLLITNNMAALEWPKSVRFLAEKRPTQANFRPQMHRWRHFQRCGIDLRDVTWQTRQLTDGEFVGEQRYP
jgi:hypothetical protein